MTIFWQVDDAKPGSPEALQADRLTEEWAARHRLEPVAGTIDTTPPYGTGVPVEIEDDAPTAKLPLSPEARSYGAPVVDAVEEHPAPWWFRVLARLFPSRVREIPEAVNPDRIVLRQFALVKRHVYIQQFASSEDARWYHSHQWRRTIAFGLWGSYTERRPGGRFSRRVRAPYCYTMGSDVVHRVEDPSRGHTSIFIGLWRDDDLKEYHPADVAVAWEKHIQKMVARI